jgi:hypothetical protein
MSNILQEINITSKQSQKLKFKTKKGGEYKSKSELDFEKKKTCLLIQTSLPSCVLIIIFL